MKVRSLAQSCRAKLFIYIGIMIFGLTVSAAWGQEVRATIGGHVTDPSGAVVPNAKVDVTSDDTGVTQHTATNNDGNWAVQFLLPGQYHLTVMASGFKKLERRGMTLQASDNKTLDVRLEVGTTGQTVEVTADVPLIDVTSASQGAVITGKLLLEMPSMSRIPTLLATLAPGVQAADQNNNPLHPWSYTGSSQIYASGVGNTASNAYLLDGMPDTKSGKDNYISYIPSPDSLQEFRVMTSAYDAQISRSGTMTINMQTKSGTDAYHGSLYEFNQNNFLNARPWESLPGDKIPPVHLNQYGFTFGGPVRIPKVYNGKEKTFFFFNWEGLKNVNLEPTLSSVPTALERQGDFSKSYTVSSGQQVAISIYNPYTVIMTGPTGVKGTRTQFDGNVIPDNMISQIAKNILKYVPLPNRTGDLNKGNASNNYWAANARKDDMSSYNLRLDHQWNDTHRSFLVARKMYNDETNENRFLDVATGKHQPRSPRAFGLDHVWTVSNNKVLDLRFSVNRYEDWQIENGAFDKFDPSTLGFPTSFTSQLQAMQFPNIKGFAGDFGTTKNTYTFSTNWSWLAGMTHMVGKHALKYGGEFWVIQQATMDWGYQPQFTFGSEWTRVNPLATTNPTGSGTAFASFLLGLPTSGTVSNNDSSFYSQHFTGVYFQDDWRATSKLTLNLGLRWDYERPVTERFDRMISQYNPMVLSPINATVQANYAANNTPANLTTYGSAFQALYNDVPVGKFQVLGAQLFAGVNGQPRTAQNPDYREFQPRIGFAYQIAPTTVVRGGVGRFARSSWESGSQTGFSQSTPYTASSDTYLTQADTLANPFVTASVNGKLLQPAGALPGYMANLGSSPKWVNPNTVRPTTWNMNLDIQQQLKNWLFDIGYVHTYTTDNWVDQDMNLQPYQLWYDLQQPVFDGTGRPVSLPWSVKVPNPFYKVAGITGSMNTSSTTQLYNLLRPLPLSSVTRNDNPIGHSQYDAAQVKVEHRFSHGFSILNSFTWSKSFTDTGYWGDQIAGAVLEHALSSQDRTFVLSIAPVWDVPIGRDRALGKNMPKMLDFIAGGWGLSGNFLIESGNPVSFSDKQDLGFYNGKDFKLSGSKQSLDQWFDTSAFMKFPSQNTCLQVVFPDGSIQYRNPYCDPSQIVSYPSWTGIQNLRGIDYYGVASDYKQIADPSDPTGVRKITVCKTTCNGVYQSFATAERSYHTTFDDIRSPRTNEVNLALAKNFHATERVNVQFRFEAFNVFNHVRFGAPGHDLSSSSFGSISKLQVNSPRAIQMALKIKF